jgi:hypothetical protein
MPRRSSDICLPDFESNIRIRVPFSDVDAMSAPEGEIARQDNLDVCAGMSCMGGEVTLFWFGSSMTWICPSDRPGNARIQELPCRLVFRATRPLSLSPVS